MKKWYNKEVRNKNIINVKYMLYANSVRVYKSWKIKIGTGLIKYKKVSFEKTALNKKQIFYIAFFQTYENGMRQYQYLGQCEKDGMSIKQQVLI
jgi:hypothetical protein